MEGSPSGDAISDGAPAHEAQAYYDVMLEQARLYTSINGVPSPIVITSWQYK